MKCVNGENTNPGPIERNSLPSKDDLEEGKSAPRNTVAVTLGISSGLQTTSTRSQPSSTNALNQPSTSFSQHQAQTTLSLLRTQNSQQHQQSSAATTSHQQPTTLGNTTGINQQTLQVPHPPGRPSVPASARRGTNIAVSKRTRFALQVQKPTGEEEGSLNQSPIGGDINGRGLSPNPRGRGRGAPSRRSRSPGPRGGINNGRQIIHSDSSQEVKHNQDLSLDRNKHSPLPHRDLNLLEGSRVIRGGGRGRSPHSTVVASVETSGIDETNRNSQAKPKLGKNGFPPHSQSGGSTDDSGQFEHQQKGKNR